MNEKTLFFHIGTPKTGTTSIQTYLDHNRDYLKQQGICYPDIRKFCTEQKIDIGRSSGYIQNGGFFEHFLGLGIRSIDMELLMQNESFAKIIRYIEECIDQTGTVLLSDESMWLRNVTDLIQYFQKKGIAVKVIVYLRNQIDYLESFWKHDIKIGLYADTFEEYLKFRKGTALIESLNYDTKLNQIEETVSKNNMTVRLYEPGKHRQDKNWVIKDFLHILGVSPSEKQMSEIYYANKSLYGDAVIFTAAYNRRYKRDYFSPVIRVFQEMSDAAVKRNPALRQQTFVSEKLKQELLNIYAESNHLVQKKYFPSRQEQILEYSEKQSVVMDFHRVNDVMFDFVTAYINTESDVLMEMKEKMDRLEQMLGKTKNDD